MIQKHKIVFSQNLLSLIRNVELDHFRTIHDTGSNPNAMIVMNAFRREAGLQYITTDDLPKWDEEKKGYYMPQNSKLICAHEILANGGKI